MSEPGSILWTPPPELADAGALPVKVRTPQGVLVASGISGAAIAVAPGSYRVGIVMPNGHELFTKGETKVEAGQSATPLVILPDEGTRTEMVSRANAASLQMTEAMTAENATSGPVSTPPRVVPAQQWCGTWLGEWANPQEALKSGLLPGTVELSDTAQTLFLADDAHDRFLITQHIAKEGLEILRFTIVPHDQCVICVGEEAQGRMIRATLREGVEPPEIKYASEFDETNALLNFVEAGVLSEMQTVSAGFINKGESAMLQSRVSLLRGLTGAYVMLRANAIDGMEAWLGQLQEMADFLPDTYTLQAEVHARRGEHDKAAQALVRATHALCPWFRAGISYLLERLKLYTDLDAETRATLGLSADEWALIEKARKRLERMAPMLVVSQIFTTFDIPK